MDGRPIILWFRRDLRTGDNPALAAAAEAGAPVLPIYVHDQDTGRAIGGAGRWWLHHSLVALGTSLARLGAPLLLRRGATVSVLTEWARTTSAGSVFWNENYDPAESETEAALRAALAAIGVEARAFAGATLLHEPPHTVRAATGRAFQVFAPFWRACAARDAAGPPLPAPAALRGSSAPSAGESIDDWSLLPTKPDWAAGLRESWRPGEDEAAARLARFRATGLHGYDRGRDHPGRDGTSLLSPHLRFGEISVRQIWHALRAENGAGAAAFRRELGWRE
ncbi:MAG: deoxyribodipyrimidine photo-lyase, partial [Alphaproteobacteria bacterium]